LIKVKETGPFGIWAAWDDYFYWIYWNRPPIGYGTTREEALGRLSEILRTEKVTPRR
jgi:hypothetical protein